MGATIFRSATFHKGMARRPGSFHFHIDCGDLGGAVERLQDLARDLVECGWPCKITRVTAALAGSHILDPEFAQDYECHTPELKAGTNTFSTYLTAVIPMAIAYTGTG